MTDPRNIDIDPDVESIIKKEERDFRLCTTCGGPLIVPVELKSPKSSDIKVKIGNNTLYISKVQARCLRRIDKFMLEYYLSMKENGSI